MTASPYVVLSCAVSLDGFLDDRTPQRLILSNAADLDRVDAVRAGCDAILVGANTVRRDDPRLVVRSEARRIERVRRGLPPDPIKVTVTATGRLDPAARFFTAGTGPKLVYCAPAAVPATRAGLAAAAEVVAVPWAAPGPPDRPGTGSSGVLAASGASIPFGTSRPSGPGLRGSPRARPAGPLRAEPPAPAGQPSADPAADPAGGPAGELPLAAVLADLAGRSVRRLLVEGGAGLLTRMLADRLADELQLVIAPFFVGDPEAPRLTGGGPTPELRLVQTGRMDDRVLLRYLLPVAVGHADPATDLRWMAAAVDLSRRCPPSPTAFSVGAVVVGSDGREIAGGYSREGNGIEHAEQSAIRKADALGADLVGGTLYSTLEPCGARLSAPEPCADLIVRRGLRRVVYALAEPELFVTPQGLRTLRSNGVTVEVVDELAEQVRAVNAHLLDQAR